MSKPVEEAVAQPGAVAVAAPKKKQPYPFWLGGVAATIAASITHPLDLTKVRMQATGDKGMINSLRKTMTYSICRFWAYDESKKLIGANEKSPAWQLALAGCMAGGIAGFVGNPGELIMVRLQSDFAKPPEKRLNYKHCIDALFRMVREEGWSSLGRGVGPNVFRAILMNASQLASYDFVKAELLHTGYFQDNVYLHTTASFAAGTIATTVCSPADVIKSRIMSASGADGKSAIQMLRTSFKNEGPMFMFKGWVPAWMRLQPTTMLIFITLEQLKRAVDWTRGDL